MAEEEPLIAETVAGEGSSNARLLPGMAAAAAPPLRLPGRGGPGAGAGAPLQLPAYDLYMSHSGETESPADQDALSEVAQDLRQRGFRVRCGFARPHPRLGKLSSGPGEERKDRATEELDRSRAVAVFLSPGYVAALQAPGQQPRAACSAEFAHALASKEAASVVVVVMDTSLRDRAKWPECLAAVREHEAIPMLPGESLDTVDQLCARLEALDVLPGRSSAVAGGGAAAGLWSPAAAADGIGNGSAGPAINGQSTPTLAAAGSVADTVAALEKTGSTLSAGSATGRGRTVENWIEEHFAELTCVAPVRDGADQARCKCGRLLATHGGAPVKGSAEPWSAACNCDRGRCTTYGSLRINKRSRKFVRVTADSDPASLIELLTLNWGLHMPRMLVSITGSATSLDLSPRLAELIQEGLRTAAVSGSAWIVTGGSNTGVMKLAGDAMSSLQSEDRPGPLIGIMSWGTVNGTEHMQDLRGGTMEYDPDDFPVPSLSVDPNHSHIIFVDNGTKDKFGGEIDFRAAFEGQVGDEVSTGEFDIKFDISSVLICIQGGPNTIKTCLSTVQKRIPLVIVNGSGGAANLIAYAYKLKYEHGSRSKRVLRTMVMEYYEPQCQKLQNQDELAAFVRTVLGDIMAIVANRDLVHLYDYDGAAGAAQQLSLDHALLNAVFQQDRQDMEKLTLTNQMMDSYRTRTLEMALLWDRIDVVKLHTRRPGVLEEFDVNLDLEHEASLSQRMRRLQRPKIQMLKYGLDSNRIDFVKLFFETMNPLDVRLFLCKKSSEVELVKLTNRVAQRARRESESAWGHRGRLSVIRKTMIERLSAYGGADHLPPHMSFEFRKGVGRLAGHHLEVLSHLDDRDIELLWAEKLLVFLVAHGFMVCFKKHDGADEPTGVDGLARDLAEYMHNLHHSGVGMVELASGVLPWSEVPDVARKAIEEQAGKLLRALEKKFTVYKPDLYEMLFVDASRKRNLSSTFLSLFQGDFRRRRVRRMMKSQFLGPDYHCSDSVFNDELSPYFHLLIWATLCQYYELADFFLRLDPKNSIANALIAASITKRLLSEDEKLSPESLSKYEDMMHAFLNFVLDITAICEHKDSEMIQRVFTSKTNEAGYIETWRMAYNIEASEVMATEAVQRVVADAWNGRIHSRNSGFKHVLVILFPPYLIWHVHPAALPAKKRRRSWSDYFEHYKYAAAFRMDVNDKAPDGRPLGWWELSKLRALGVYSAPSMAFWLQALAYFVFLILFSMATVAPMTTFLDGFETIEGRLHVTVAIWMVTLMVDEFRQLLMTGFAKWSASLWNRMDLLVYVLYLTAFYFGDLGTTEALDVSHTLHAFISILLWVRLGRFYAVSKRIGPKLVMIQEMLGDITVFVALIVLVLVGYGVASYALLFPVRPWDEETAVDIFYRPYFQMYGELFLEDIQSESGCLGTNFSSCNRAGGFLVLLLLVVFMLVANILLVNLLIAMMSATYERVEAEALRVWSLQSVELLDEFTDRWFFPTPFDLFRNVYLGLYGLYHTCCKTIPTNSVFPEDLGLKPKTTYNPKKPFPGYHRIRSFTEQNTDVYYTHRQRQLAIGRGSHEDAMSHVLDSLGKLQAQLLEIERRQQQHANSMHTTLDLLKGASRSVVDDYSSDEDDRSFIYSKHRLRPSPNGRSASRRGSKEPRVYSIAEATATPEPLAESSADEASEAAGGDDFTPVEDTVGVAVPSSDSAPPLHEVQYHGDVGPAAIATPAIGTMPRADHHTPGGSAA